MQLAAPEKDPVTPLFARSPFLTYQSRNQLRAAAILSVAFFIIVFLLIHLFLTSTGAAASPIGSSGVVIVTVLDRAFYSETYLEKIVKNREDYAARHGELLMLSFLKQGLQFTFVLSITQDIPTSSQTCPTTSLT